MQTRIYTLLTTTLLVLAGSHAALGQYGPPRMMAPGQGMAAPMMQGSPYGPPIGQMAPPQMAIGSGVAPIGAFAPPGQMIMPVGAALGCSDGCTDGGCTGAGGCAGGGCASGGSGLFGNRGCGNAGCCCQGSCNTMSFYGEFLYLRARDAEVAFAHVTNAAVAPPGVPIQVSPLGMVDPDFEPAFRGGFTTVLDPCSSLSLQYTMFESDTSSQVGPAPFGLGVQGLLFHPQTGQAAATGVGPATAVYNISFDAVDLDYRQLISRSCNHKVNFLIGLRYASMEQQLLHSLPVLGQDTVDTDIDFEGVGARLGLEYDRNLQRGLSVYGRLHGSLLAGEWTADYDQGQNFDGSVVDTSWKAGRITPVIDLELGMGWTSESGFWTFQAGYVYSAWFNGINTDNWIKAVQSNNFVDIGDQITFDGLTARVETRF